MPTYCQSIYNLNSGCSDKPDQVSEIIEFANTKLSIDLSGMRQEMEDAKMSGCLEFTYLGPGQSKGTGANIWNCSLTTIRKVQYFFSDTGYDSRSTKNA